MCLASSVLYGFFVLLCRGLLKGRRCILGLLLFLIEFEVVLLFEVVLGEGFVFSFLLLVLVFF